MCMCAYWGEWRRTDGDGHVFLAPHSWLTFNVLCSCMQVLDMWGTVMLTKEDTNAYGLGWAWTGELY